MLYATIARVDLGAIEANVRAVRQHVGDRSVLVAVKADAYGHGAVAVSRMLAETGTADWLGVATVPEGIALRAAGITLPILKLSHVLSPIEAEAAVDADIALTVIDEAGARMASVAGGGRRRAQVHLKVDTGMRRIGVEPAGAVALARLLRTLPGIALEGVMTHLPISDAPAGDSFTDAQLSLFHEVAAAVQAEVGHLPYVHAANSGGICGHPESWGTLVRPGIMAYGSYPDHATPRTVPLRPALSLVSRVSYVKRISRGETVGYGRTWTATRDTCIATVPIGYADGYSRLLSNRGSMLVGGERHPIAGRVCMDQTMLDLGPDTSVRAGDEVVAIGRQGQEEITAWDVADLMDTIPYEVTCLLAPRVTRVYG
jgi:alanine racemase